MREEEEEEGKIVVRVERMRGLWVLGSIYREGWFFVPFFFWLVIILLQDKRTNCCDS